MKHFTTSLNRNREGTTMVEFAFVFPVFLTFLFAMWEFTHAYMVLNVLNSAANKAARYGVSKDVTTADVSNKVLQMVDSAFQSTNATVLVKDASVFDVEPVNPNDIDYGALPDIELVNAEPQQLFVVQVSVPYDDVAIMTPFFAKSLQLHGQAVMRHE